jgi:hypothetical protein
LDGSWDGVVVPNLGLIGELSLKMGTGDCCEKLGAIVEMEAIVHNILGNKDKDNQYTNPCINI